MALSLTAGALSMMLSNLEDQLRDLKPVVQVTNIRTVSRHISNRGEDTVSYEIMISDGSYCHPGILDPDLNKMIRSQQLKKGSFVRLTGFSRTWLSNSMTITIKDVDVIFGEWNIIGDPKPITYGLVHATDVHDKQQKAKYDIQNPSKKQKREPSIFNPKNLVEPFSKDAGTTMEKNREDDEMGDCIQKLEKLGWKTQDSWLYDTALLLFSESSVNKKVWLHLLNPESCVKWVRIVGTKYGLLG